MQENGSNMKACAHACAWLTALAIYDKDDNICKFREIFLRSMDCIQRRQGWGRRDTEAL